MLFTQPKIFFMTLGALATAACNSGAPTYISTGAAASPQISVSATGKTEMAPDTASVSAGVVTQGRDAGSAMRENAAKMTEVFAELKKAGLKEKNITTSRLSLQPKYNYQDRQSPEITGYEARNTVTAKTYDMNAVGPMLDALVAAGVNNINQVRFSVKDPKAAKAAARKDAIIEAKEKAQEMADAAGVTLGRITSISESTGGFQPQSLYAARGMAMGGAGSASTPIAAGEQTLSVTVNLTYEIAK